MTISVSNEIYQSYSDAYLILYKKNYKLSYFINEQMVATSIKGKCNCISTSYNTSAIDNKISFLSHTQFKKILIKYYAF